MSAFPTKDVEIVRALACQAMALATSESYEVRRRRWRDANERRKGDRAPVWCRPAGMWAEVLPEESLRCTDRLCRSVEYRLRQHLYKDWVGDDHIFEPWWGVSAVWRWQGEHVWGLPTGRQVESTEKGGFRYEHAVQTLEDYERVTIPAFSYDGEATERELNRVGELLGEAMPVRMECAPPLGPHQGSYLEQLRGMEPMLNDIAFRPWVVHRTMARLTEGVLGALRAAEATGLLTTNHHQPMMCSDPVGETAESGESKVESDGGGTRLRNLWVDANSQEFQVVSPRMTEEFLFSYLMPVFQQYGAVQFGCCEDLSQKVEQVLRIPNLRIFVSSYWTDLDKVLEACGRRYTIMWRQHAANTVFAHDMGPIRAHLEQGLRKLKGHHYQIVLRELQTLNGRPERLREWARVAIEMAERYS
ncbi:MAG: hypothetical protein ACE149_19075 [Armatimonadota bacterium]